MPVDDEDLDIDADASGRECDGEGASGEEGREGHRGSSGDEINDDNNKDDGGKPAAIGAGIDLAAAATLEPAALEPAAFVPAAADVKQNKKGKGRPPRTGVLKANMATAAGAKTGTFWGEEEMIELLRLGRDEVYRARITGSSTPDWAAIGKRLGRGARAAKRKFDNLVDVDVAVAEGKYVLKRPPNDGMKWNDEEVLELLEFGDPNNRALRLSELGTAEVDWGRIAKRFGRSRDTVTYKFDYEVKGRFKAAAKEGKTTDSPDGGGSNSGTTAVGVTAGKSDSHSSGKSSGKSSDGLSYKPSDTGVEYTKEDPGTSRVGRPPTRGPEADPTKTYHNMTVKAFDKINPESLEATSSQIFAFVEKDEVFVQQLDRSIQQGKKNVPRWKHSIRSALYAYPYFVKTNKKLGGEQVYRLDLAALKDAERKAEEKAMIAAANRRLKAERSARAQERKAANAGERRAGVELRKVKVKSRITTEKQVAAEQVAAEGSASVLVKLNAALRPTDTRRANGPAEAKRHKFAPNASAGKQPSDHSLLDDPMPTFDTSADAPVVMIPVTGHPHQHQHPHQHPHPHQHQHQHLWEGPAHSDGATVASHPEADLVDHSAVNAEVMRLMAQHQIPYFEDDYRARAMHLIKNYEIESLSAEQVFYLMFAPANVGGHDGTGPAAMSPEMLPGNAVPGLYGGHISGHQQQYVNGFEAHSHGFEAHAHAHAIEQQYPPDAEDFAPPPE